MIGKRLFALLISLMLLMLLVSPVSADEWKDDFKRLQLDLIFKF